MDISSKDNIPKLNLDAKSDFDVVKSGRNFGATLGLMISIYLIIINIAYSGSGEEVAIPMGIRFAKHLLIIPAAWMAISAYANSMEKGHVFKGGIGLLVRIGLWASLTIGAINLLFYIITSSSFAQFLNQGETFLTATVNSGFLLFETMVFVMIIGFIILQAFKDRGSPED